MSSNKVYTNKMFSDVLVALTRANNYSIKNYSIYFLGLATRVDFLICMQYVYYMIMNKHSKIKCFKIIMVNKNVGYNVDNLLLEYEYS